MGGDGGARLAGGGEVRPQGQSDQGVSEDRYTVVPRVLCFLHQGGDILLLKGAPDKRLWANRYNGIGGHVERDEDPYQAARREIREESGLEVDDLRLGGIVHVTLSQGPGVLLFLFTGEARSRETRPSAEGQLVWVSPEQFSRLPVVEDLPVFYARLFPLSPGAAPFFARSTYDEAGRRQVTFSRGGG